MVKSIQELDPDELKAYIETTFPVPKQMQSAYSEWIDTLIMKDTSKYSVYVYAETVSEFSNLVKKPPSAVVEEDIKSYVRYLQKKGAAPYTIVNYLQRVGIFLKAHGNNINVHKFAPKLKVRVPEYLTEEEVQKFLNAIDESVVDSDEPDKALAVMRFKVLFTLLADTGLRATEACNIEKNDVDFNERLIIVRHGKRDKYREVPVSKKTLSVLKSYWAMRKDNLPYVFEYKGRQLDRMVIWRMTKRIAKKAGINVRTRTHGPAIYPHMFRHTFATLELKRLIRSGKGRMDALLVIKEALGHSDIETTLIYLTLLGEDIRDMMGR